MEKRCISCGGKLVRTGPALYRCVYCESIHHMDGAKIRLLDDDIRHELEIWESQIPEKRKKIKKNKRVVIITKITLIPLLVLLGMLIGKMYVERELHLGYLIFLGLLTFFNYLVIPISKDENLSLEREIKEIIDTIDKKKSLLLKKQNDEELDEAGNSGKSHADGSDPPEGTLENSH